MIDVFSQTKTIKQLYNGREELNTDLAIQRSSDLWSEETKSSLIHSILYGFPIPSIWAVNETGVIDGKQRLTTIFDYIDNKFALSSEIEDIEGQKISGLTFEKLPENFKDRIFDFSLTITFLKNITEQEVEDFFQKINNGLSLSKIEITRTLASSKIMTFVQKIASNKFFSETINLTESNRKRFIDEELILQILSLIVNEDPIALSGAEIRAFAKQLRHTGISEKHQEIMRETTEYLNLAIPDKSMDYRKVHIPMLFLMAIQAQQLEIPHQKFGGWVQKFFDKKTYKMSSYKNDFASSKTASLQNVTGRIKEMQKFFDEHIETAQPYKTPTPGQRGRKPKEIALVITNTPPDGFVASVEHLTLKPLDDTNKQSNSSDENWEEFKQEFPNEDTEKVV